MDEKRKRDREEKNVLPCNDYGGGREDHFIFLLSYSHPFIFPNTHTHTHTHTPK